MNANVLLNVLNVFGEKQQNVRLLFCNKFSKFNSARAQTLDSIYRMTLDYFEISFLT